MKSKVLFIIFTLIIPRLLYADIVSDFEQGVDDWSISGGSNLILNPAGGNPGQHLCATNPEFWVAPNKFLGNVSSYYDGRLLFNLRVGDNDDSFDFDVVLEHINGIKISYDIVNPGTFSTSTAQSGANWTSYSIPLHGTAGWRVIDAFGEPSTSATEQLMLSILGQLADIKIRGDFDIGTDSGCIDNIELRLPEPTATSNIVSHFDNDAESWAALFNGSNHEFRSSGGNPGGHVCATNSIYWKAPAKFLGKMGNFYDGRLLFNLKVSDNDNAFPNDVILEGPYSPNNSNERLILAFEIRNPGPEWTSYSIPLHELAGWVKLVNGSPTTAPTQQELQTVLDYLVDLRIRGDYDVGTDTGCIDNVELRLPEPAINSNVISHFDNDSESWAATGSGSNQIYSASGGNPPEGGHVCATNPTSWKAPAKFLGKIGNFYGGRLLFDLKVSDNDNAFSNDVILEGPYNSDNLNERLILAFDIQNPGLDWTSYSIPLNETSGWVKIDTSGSPTVPPNQQEMQTILKLLNDLRIRGDYDIGTDTGCLDNVELRLTEQTLIYDIIVSPTANLQTAEEGGTATFSMVLTHPPSSDVTVRLSSSNTFIGIVEPASFTFNAANWNIAQVAIITGLTDANSNNDIPYRINTLPAESEDINYDGRDPDDVNVTSVNTVPPPIDADIFVSAFANGNNETDEFGNEIFFSVSLRATPTADVRVSLEISQPDEAIISPSTIIFTSIGSPSKLIKVTGLDDFVIDGDQQYMIEIKPAESDDERYDGIDPSDLTAINLDNDVAGISVGAISGNTREDGRTAFFDVSLSVRPTDDVAIKLASDDSTEGVVSLQEIVFTPEDWESKQITVIGQDDSEIDGNQSFNVITLPVISLDNRFDGLNPADLIVINEDDELGNEPNLIFQNDFE